MGVPKLTTETDQNASPAVTKKRTVREDDSPQQGKVPFVEREKDEMYTDQGMEVSPVVVQHIDATDKTPRHDD